MEAIKTICCVKSGDAIDHSTVTKSFNKFYLGCKNLNDHIGLKLDSEAVLQAIDTNPVSRTPRVSGELGISQSIMVSHFHELGKTI